MRFELIDRILELSSGERIVAVKAVSLAEEYLSDHFPTFPVLPGVLMLEAFTQAAAWLVREAQDFSSGVNLLRYARNVTYRSFVKPGNLLRVEILCRRLARDDSDFEGIGYCNQEEAVRAKFGLMHFSPRRDGAEQAAMDQQLVAQARARFAFLRQ